MVRRLRRPLLVGLAAITGLESSEGLIVNPINGDWNRLSEPDAQKILPRRIRVVSSPSPDQVMKTFLESVLAEKRVSQ